MLTMANAPTAGGIAPTKKSTQALMCLREQGAADLCIYLAQVKGEQTGELTPTDEDNVLGLLVHAMLRLCPDLLFEHPLREGYPEMQRTRAAFVKLHSRDPSMAIVLVDGYKVKLPLKYLQVPLLPTGIRYGTPQKLYTFLASKVNRMLVSTTLEEVAFHACTRDAESGAFEFALGSDLFCMCTLLAKKERTNPKAFWGMPNNPGAKTPFNFSMPLPLSSNPRCGMLNAWCDVDPSEMRAIGLVTQWVLQRLADEPEATDLPVNDDDLFIGITSKGVLKGPLSVWKEYIECTHVNMGLDKLHGRCARELLAIFGAPTARVTF